MRRARDISRPIGGGAGRAAFCPPLALIALGLLAVAPIAASTGYAPCDSRLRLSPGPAQASATGGCSGPVDRFGERLLAIDADIVAVGSPYSGDGAGWWGVVDKLSCTVLQAWEGEVGAHLGWSLVCGDLDRDGTLDLVVGAPGTITGSTRGEVRVHLGGARGWAETPSQILVETKAGESFGESVALLDSDRDGWFELAVGASTYSGREVFEGAVRLYAASTAGVDTVPSWIQYGRAPAACFGRSLAAADFDGDGHDDLLVGAPEGSWGQNREGRAEIFLGGAHTGLRGVPSWSREGGEAYAYFGLSLGGLGLPAALGGGAMWAVGAPGSRGSRGRVSIFRGPGFPVGPAAVWEGAEVGGWLGVAVAPVEGQGFGALRGFAFGAPGAAQGSGCVQLLLFEPCASAARFVSLEPGPPGSFLGAALSAAAGNLWIGAPWEEGEERRGAIYRCDPGAVGDLAGGPEAFPGEPSGRAGEWRVRLAPHPISAGTQLSVVGPVPCTPLRWECISVEGRRLASGSWLGAEPLGWDAIGRFGRRTGWLVVTDGRRRETLRWVDLRGAG